MNWNRELVENGREDEGRYERDEMMPSKDAAKNIASFLNTTVGYLLGKNDNADLFKDLIMLTRLVELQNMNSADKSHFLHVLNGFIVSFKLRNIAAL